MILLTAAYLSIKSFIFIAQKSPEDIAEIFLILNILSWFYGNVIPDALHINEFALLLLNFGK